MKIKLENLQSGFQMLKVSMRNCTQVIRVSNITMPVKCNLSNNRTSKVVVQVQADFSDQIRYIKIRRR
jgi:hypothetical protein